MVSSIKASVLAEKIEEVKPRAVDQLGSVLMISSQSTAAAAGDGVPCYQPPPSTDEQDTKSSGPPQMLQAMEPAEQQPPRIDQ